MDDYRKNNKQNYSYQYFHKYFSHYRIIKCIDFESIHYIINFDVKFLDNLILNVLVVE